VWGKAFGRYLSPQLNHPWLHNTRHNKSIIFACMEVVPPINEPCSLISSPSFQAKDGSRWNVHAPRYTVYPSHCHADRFQLPLRTSLEMNINLTTGKKSSRLLAFSRNNGSFCIRRRSLSRGEVRLSPEFYPERNRSIERKLWLGSVSHASVPYHSARLSDTRCNIMRNPA